MGILGLKQPLLQFLNKKEYHDSIYSLRNMTLGVDLSVWLNLAIFSSQNVDDVARSFACQPRQSNAHYIRKFLNKALLFLNNYDIKIVLVFDGCRSYRIGDRNTIHTSFFINTSYPIVTT